LYKTLIFTARRYIRVSAVLVVGWCLSVCLSVCHTRALHRNGLRYHKTFFLGQAVQTHQLLFFLNPSAINQFQGTPLHLGFWIHGVGKIHGFRQKLPFISETVWNSCYGTLI